jgi:nucleoside-diphosphate-sugar epimerase
MRILVIGGTGFIGPHVVAELVRLGHETAVLHRGTNQPQAGVRSIVGDRRRLHEALPEIRAFGPDVVVDMILSNEAQARELVQACRGIADRIVALSSMDVYRACGVAHGLEAGELEPLPLTESSALRTKPPYPPEQVKMLQQVFGWLDDEYDKIPVEREILGHDTPAGTILRLPMVYGPGDPLHRFQPIVKRITDGRRTIVMSAGMASWRGTKGYVQNVGVAVAAAAGSPRAAGRVYNVGEIDTLTELEWAQEIAREMQWDGEFVLLPNEEAPAHLRAPGNTAQHWVADTSRIHDELGDVESIPRDEAIRRTIEWELEHPPAGFTPHVFDYDAEDLR